MPQSPRPPIAEGLYLSIPVMLGYLPVGFTFGLLAVRAGLNPLTAALMSYFVYAGSAQLIAVSLLTSGVGVASIILTTFVVNLRHLLMSAAVAPHLRSWSKLKQAWFAYGMTDETFAVHMGGFAAGKPARAASVLTVNTATHWCWTLSGLAGALFGDFIGDIKPFGLDFALPGMFIALLLPHAQVSRKCLALSLGALFSIAAQLLGAGQWGVMIATPAAALIAAFGPFGGQIRKEAA